jgi:uncharacterized protein YjbI with pentapeptide repeats
MSKHIRKVLGPLQHRKQIPPPHQQPTSRTPEEWSTYWEEQGQPWRTEPEIDKKRQEYLAKRRLITPNIEQGIYPFKDVKLSRADVEWLLATHENGRGPVDWSDESQRNHDGLDLRGTDLCHVDLQQLPLARLRCGFTHDEQIQETEAQCAMARAHMEDVFLNRAQLQGAYLHNVLLVRSQLVEAKLEGADLSFANLQEVNLMQGEFKQANLKGARLQEANLYRAQLEEANLYEAKLNGANLRDVMLGGQKHIGPLLADVQWTEVNLARVNWSQGMILGDEQRARQKKAGGKNKTREERLLEYESAVRAYRQLAVALQTQGLNEEAAHFAYRAQVLQKSVLWYQMTQQRVPFRQRMQALGGLFFSWFLFLLAGYGYKPIRSVLAYLAIIFGFMGLYLLNAHFIAPHLTWDEALVLSVSSFHGRGFFTQNVTLGDTYARLAAVEAIVGLFIEISFIATFTQRFFGK